MAKIQMEPSTLLYPLPVVLISCGEMDNKPNIITIAWTGVVCSDPPMVSISVRPHRHSAQIIRQTREFVVNIPTEDMLRKVDRCGVISGKQYDKFKEVGLTMMKAAVVGCPLIQECPVNLECKVTEIKALGAHEMYLAEVVAAHADEEVLEGGEIQVAKARAPTYCPVNSEYWSLGSKIGDYGFTKRKKGN